jgi:hypothetical protein
MMIKKWGKLALVTVTKSKNEESVLTGCKLGSLTASDSQPQSGCFRLKACGGECRLRTTS